MAEHASGAVRVMSSTYESMILTVCMDCLTQQVFDYVHDPAILPRWATAFDRSAHRLAGGWMIDTVSEPAMIYCTPDNEFGVVDHRLRTAAGDEIHVPMRRIAHGTGSEVQFALFRLPGTSDEQFAADAMRVRKDL